MYKSPVKTILPLGVVTLLSVLFRIGPINFVPEFDEGLVVTNLENFYRTGSLQPTNFIHPPLYHYLCWAVEGVVLKLQNGRPLYETYALYHFNDVQSIYRVCRGAHWFLGVSTAPALFWLAWRLYNSRWIATLAGIFVAISFSHASRSAFALTDVPVTLFFTVAVGLALLSVRRGSSALLYLGAFMAGIATAIKWNGVIGMMPVVAISWWKSDHDSYSKHRKRTAALLFFMAVSAVALIWLSHSEAWKISVEYFSQDGRVEPESYNYFKRIMGSLSMLATIGLVIVSLLYWRLLRADRFFEGGVHELIKPTVTQCLDKTLTFISSYRLYLAIFLFALGFIILNPYWVILFKTFAAILVLTTIHVQMAGHFGMEGPNWIWYFSKVWQEEHLLSLLLVLGIVVALWRRNALTKAVAIFVLVLFLYIGSWAEKAIRFILPLLPLACMVTSAALWNLVEERRKLKPLLLGLICVVVISQAASVYSEVRDRSRTDSRQLALMWIEEHIPSGSRLLIDHYMPVLHSKAQLDYIRAELTLRGMPSVQEQYERFPIYHIKQIEEGVFHSSVQGLDWSHFDFVVLTSFAYNRYLDPSQVPPIDNPRYSEYFLRQHFYEAILLGHVPQLERVIQFEGSTLRGPVLTIYKVRGS